MKKNRWFETIGLISLLLTLFTLAITLTINFRPLYVFDIHYLNILDYTTLSQEKLLENYDLLLRFLNNPFQGTLALPDFSMSAAGLGHFYDVKKLFILNYGVLLVTLPFSCFYVYHMAKNQRLWKMIMPFKWAMVLPLVFGAVMATGFDFFFVKFHQFFFQNDDWLFDPVTDPIINVLPEQFFMHSFILFFLLIEAFFLFFYVWGKRSLKK